MSVYSHAKANTVSTKAASTRGYWSFPARVPSAAMISSRWKISSPGGQRMGMMREKTQTILNLMKTITATDTRMEIGFRGMLGLRLGGEDEDMMNQILRIRTCPKHR